MKRLSVIIPGYNTPKVWWQRCVASVQAAIRSDDEIIVVDDGSKIPVEANWFSGDIKVVRRDNGGLSRARNTALEIAQGEYVTFVDSDDEVNPETFARCLTLLQKSESDICLYGVDVVWTKEGLHKCDRPDNRVYGKLTSGEVQDLSKRCLLNFAWNKIYRKSFLDQHRLHFNPDGMPCEDIIFNLDCIIAGAKWCSVDYVGYVYYRVSGGRTILSSYKPTNNLGLALGADAWRRYCETLSQGVTTPLMSRAALSAQQVLALEWKNIWMPGTPYSLLGRWLWLRQHPEIGGVYHFIKTIMLMFIRRYFYFRFVRRWNIKHQYPHASECPSCDNILKDYEYD